MKIIVFIKAVPSGTVPGTDNSGDMFTMNPYDVFALEQCIALKKRAEGEVTVETVAMGPKGAESVLKRTLAMGADKATLICDRMFAGSDTIATSYVLSRYFEKYGGADIAVTGKKAVDGETGQVSYALAERLGLETADNVVSAQRADDGEIMVTYTEDMRINKAKIMLPVMLIFKKFTLKSGTISLLARKRAGKVNIINAQDLECDPSMCGLEGSRTMVVNLSEEHVEKEKREIAGNPNQKAREILNMVLGRSLNAAR